MKKFTSGFEYDLQNEPLVISKSILDLFLSKKEPAPLIALYSFYYYTAKWQKTNQPHATTKYVANGLKWGADKVRKYKKQLKSLGLIEDIQKKDKNNLFTKSYIKVNFIWSKTTIANKISRSNDFSECGDSRTVENTETNALSAITENALSTNKEILFNQFWYLYDYNIKREKCKKMFLRLSLKTIQLILDHVPKYVRSTPNKQYRSHPSTYLNNNCWEDEIIEETKNGKNKKSTGATPEQIAGFVVRRYQRMQGG